MDRPGAEVQPVQGCRGPRSFLSPAEFQRLRQELPEHLADMALFSVATGLRQAKVKDLEWQYVDLDRMHLWIPASQHKNRKPHSVPLNEMALSVLRKLQGRHATRVFTFRGELVVQVSTLAPEALQGAAARLDAITGYVAATQEAIAERPTA